VEVRKTVFNYQNVLSDINYRLNLGFLTMNI